MTSVPVTIGSVQTFPARIGNYWSPGVLMIDSLLIRPNVNVSQNTNFILTVIDSVSGCRSKDTMLVTALPIPLDTIIPVSSLNTCGDSIIIQSSVVGAGKTYAWSLDGGDPITFVGLAINGPHNVSYANPGSYTIRMQVTNTSNSCFIIDSILHSVACVLPVNLISLAVEQSNCKDISVKWSVVNELNIDYYTVNAVVKNEIVASQKIASQNSTLLHAYNSSFSVNDKIDFISLWENTINGQTNFIAQKSVDSDCVPLLKVYPNPISKQALDLFISSNTTISDLKCYNSIGKAVEMPLKKVGVNLYSADISSYTSGVYSLIGKGINAKFVVLD